MLLTFIFLILIASIFILLFIDNKKKTLIQIFSLSSSALVLVLSSILFYFFDSKKYGFQEALTLDIGTKLFNANISFGFDALSIFFFFLSSFLIFICILFC